MTHSKSENPAAPANRNSRITLQTRLVLFMLFIALTPLVLISSRNIYQTQQALNNGAEISLLSSAKQTANNLDTFFKDTLRSIEIESNFSAFSSYLLMEKNQRQGSLEYVRAWDLLEKLSLRDPDNLVSYGLIDSKGNILLDTGRGITKNNESDEIYFPLVQFSEHPIVTAVTYAEDGTTNIYFASRVLDRENKFIGILRVKYRSAVLQSVIAENIGKDPEVSVLLLDQLNIRMADLRNPELILKSITPLTQVDYLLAVDTKRFLNRPREDQTTYLTAFDNALDNAKTQPYFRAELTPNTPGDDSIAIAYLTSQPWTIVYSRPSSIFLSAVQRQINTNILLVVVTLFLVVIVATLLARTFTNPIIKLSQVANSISQGDLNARAQTGSTDEIGTLATAFNSMTDQLQSTLTGLEERISERTAALQKNNLQLETIADVAREIAVIRDMNTLLNVSANLIRERLRYYHVGIFLVDERNEYAILRGASSIAAETMLARNYKLKVGQTGLVGNVTRTGQAYIALDVGTDAVHFENPFLPDTRSEIALPLRAHGLTIGALDIQATVSNSFGERDIQTFQILADQLSAAIENAQLAQRVEVTLRELTQTNRAQTQRAWQSTIAKRELPAYEYDGLKVTPVPRDLAPELLKLLEGGKPVEIKPDRTRSGTATEQKNVLMIPLMLSGELIGAIGLEQEDPEHVWSGAEIAVAQAAANRAALSLENSRLLDESQRRAAREQSIGQITARIGTGTEIDSILKIAIRELGSQISGAQISIEMGSDEP